jgi:hypothetical protein
LPNNGARKVSDISGVRYLFESHRRQGAPANAGVRGSFASEGHRLLNLHQTGVIRTLRVESKDRSG